MMLNAFIGDVTVTSPSLRPVIGHSLYRLDAIAELFWGAVDFASLIFRSLRGRSMTPLRGKYGARYRPKSQTTAAGSHRWDDRTQV